MKRFIVSALAAVILMTVMCIPINAAFQIFDFQTDLLNSEMGLEGYIPQDVSDSDTSSAFMIPNDYNRPCNVNWEFNTIDGSTVDWQTYIGRIQILIFYRPDGLCSNSNNTISAIAKSDWVRNSKVKVIAVAWSDEPTDELRLAQSIEYKNKYAPNCDDIVFAYGNSSQISSALRGFDNLQGVNSNGWMFAVNYIIDANNNFRFSWMGNLHSAYYESVLSLIDNDFSMNGIYKTAVDGYEEYSETLEVLRLLNKYRKLYGLNELETDVELINAAMQRAAECALYYDHIRSNGELCSSALPSRALTTSFGENIAAGQISARQVMTSWKNSPGHNRNMLESSYKSVGIGCFTDNNGNKFWVQIFSGSAANHDSVNFPTRLKTQTEVVVNSGVVSLDISPLELKIPKGSDRKITLTNKNTEFRNILNIRFTYAVSENSKLADVRIDESGNVVVTAINEGNVFVNVGLLSANGGEPLKFRVPITILPPYTPADVNSDGEVTLDDAVMTLQRAMNIGTSSSFNESAADVTGDGAITLDDAVAILKMAMKVSS